MRWAALGIALWPVWFWYFQRLSDRSDEPLGIVALITFLALLWLNPAKVSRDAPSVAATTVLILYAGAHFCAPSAPQLVLACLAVAAVGLCLSGRKLATGLTIGDWSLLFLSLPIVASLNFYLGYPLRLLVCNLAVPLLSINGFVVVGQGTTLVYNGQAIEIDAPCSGIRMLWAALYLAATLASLRNLTWGKGAAYVLLALVLAIFANVLRVTSLFYLETGTISLPQQIGSLVHEGVGVAVFFILAIGLLLLAGKLAPPQSAQDEEEHAVVAQSKSPVPVSFFVVCAACAILPLFLSDRDNQQTTAVLSTPKSGWPATFGEEVLRPVPLSARGAQLAATFPGEIKVFTAGRRTVIFRFIQKATRQLHPASDCYRASGFEIQFLPVYADAQGLRWGACQAVRGTERLQIHERIFDDDGNNWTDVSTWYWAALVGKNKGPWWSVVTVGAARAN